MKPPSVKSTADIGTLCSTFNSALHDRESPRIEDWLPRGSDELRADGFRKLLQAEVSYICLQQREPDWTDYEARFPEFVTCIREAESFFSDAQADDSHPNSLTSTFVGADAACSIGGTESSRRPGDSAGRYRLVEKIGTGGFGEVWRGFDPELDRSVAIKVARSDRALPAPVAEQQLSEARKAASLTHRNIVPVYDVCREESGLVVISELIRGMTLADRIRQGRIPVDEAVEIVTHVADALHYAHLADLVHRDVKPGNILLRENGDALLTDFGLALTEQEQMTDPGGIVGTIRYMSPEQARGDSNLVDARTDVYALGVVFFELLTGRLPYPSRERSSYLNDVIVRPPRPPRTIDDRIPVPLEKICLRCLEKRPEARFGSCAELRDALADWQESASAAKSAAPQTRTLLAGVLGIIGVIIAAVLVPLAWRPPPLPDPEPDRPPISENWTTLLDQKPQIESWRASEGMGAPWFDAAEYRYGIRSEWTEWIALTREVESRSCELRGVISVDDWVGSGGFVWAYHDLPDAFPDRETSCLVVEFSGLGTDKPSELVLRRVDFREAGPGDMQKTSGRTIDSIEVTPPTSREATLHIVIQSNGITVEFDGRTTWQPADPDNRTEWLPAGGMSVGLTGQGGEFSVRNYSIRMID